MMSNNLRERLNTAYQSTSVELFSDNKTLFEEPNNVAEIVIPTHGEKYPSQNGDGRAE